MLVYFLHKVLNEAVDLRVGWTIINDIEKPISVIGTSVGALGDMRARRCHQPARLAPNA